MLERSVRGALTATANSSSATPAVWGLIAQLNEAQGYPDSARDAYKKQARLSHPFCCIEGILNWVWTPESPSMI